MLWRIHTSVISLRDLPQGSAIIGCSRCLRSTPGANRSYRSLTKHPSVDSIPFQNQQTGGPGTALIGPGGLLRVRRPFMKDDQRLGAMYWIDHFVVGTTDVDRWGEWSGE